MFALNGNDLIFQSNYSRDLDAEITITVFYRNIFAVFFLTLKNFRFYINLKIPYFFLKI